MGSMGVQDNGTTQLWLRLYEHGTADQKAEAAVQLGLLLEQRGLLAEAVEWYEQNIGATRLVCSLPTARRCAAGGGSARFPASSSTLRASRVRPCLR